MDKLCTVTAVLLLVISFIVTVFLTLVELPIFVILQSSLEYPHVSGRMWFNTCWSGSRFLRKRFCLSSGLHISNQTLALVFVLSYMPTVTTLSIPDRLFTLFPLASVSVLGTSLLGMSFFLSVCVLERERNTVNAVEADSAITCHIVIPSKYFTRESVWFC